MVSRRFQGRARLAYPLICFAMARPALAALLLAAGASSALFVQDQGDPAGAALAVANLGLMASQRQQYEEALGLYDEALEFAREHAQTTALILSKRSVG